MKNVISPNNHLGDTAEQALANAIIVKAAEDYRAAKTILQKQPDNKGALIEIDSLLKFFRSDWFKVLTKVKAEFLISKLDAEFA